jgi:hypothetical protein
MLPPTDSSVFWVAGSSVQVAWGMRYNHGGGYQYRLCPLDYVQSNASSIEIEQCFQQMPLEFVRSEHSIMWNNGTLQKIKGIFVGGDIVVPRNSTWVSAVEDQIRRFHLTHWVRCISGTQSDPSCEYRQPRPVQRDRVWRGAWRR